MPPMMVSACGLETRMTLAHTIAPQGNEVQGALKLLELISLKGNQFDLVQPEASSHPIRRTCASELASEKLY